MPTTDSKALALVRWIADQAITGAPGMKSARTLAQEVLDDPRYTDAEARVRRLIARETTKNFATGFLTGFGGLRTLPIALPAALGAAWAIQARMAAAIAILHGHDVGEDSVRTFVVLSLVGDAGKQALKRAGVRVGQRLAEKTIQQIPARALVELNKKAGMRLVTTGAERGVVSLSKAIPFIGAMVGGAFDAAACRAVGKIAHELFRSDESLASESVPVETPQRSAPGGPENGSSGTSSTEAAT